MKNAEKRALFSGVLEANSETRFQKSFPTTWPLRVFVEFLRGFGILDFSLAKKRAFYASKKVMR
jgi:hypothetical protein